MLNIILAFVTFGGFLSMGIDKLLSSESPQAAIFFFCSLVFLGVWIYTFRLRWLREKSAGRGRN